MALTTRAIVLLLLFHATINSNMFAQGRTRNSRKRVMLYRRTRRRNIRHFHPQGEVCPDPRASKSYKLTFVANQPVEVFIEGVEVSAQENPETLVEVDLVDVACKDIYFKLSNSNDYEPVAVSAIVEYNGEIYGTRQIVKVEDGEGGYNFIKVEDPTLLDIKPLYALAFKDVDPDFDNPNYNSSSWPPARIVDSVLDEPLIEFAKMEKLGALPICWMDGPQDAGTFGVKLLLPFCYSRTVENYM